MVQYAKEMRILSITLIYNIKYLNIGDYTNICIRETDSLYIIYNIILRNIYLNTDKVYILRMTYKSINDSWLTLRLKYFLLEIKYCVCVCTWRKMVSTTKSFLFCRKDELFESIRLMKSEGCFIYNIPHTSFFVLPITII